MYKSSIKIGCKKDIIYVTLVLRNLTIKFRNIFFLIVLVYVYNACICVLVGFEATY